MSRNELIALTIGVIAFFGSMAYMTYATKECKIEAIKANKTGEEIKNICGR